MTITNPKINWNNYGGYWLNDWVNYQGLLGRYRPVYPQINFMEVFANKKANILVQEIEVEANDPYLQAWLQKINWTNLVRDCIQQASINGYAIVDIQRCPNREHAIETFVYCNPFPSPYDQFSFTNFYDDAEAVNFQTCFTSQKFQTPYIAVVSKTRDYFIITDIGGFDGNDYLWGSYAFTIPDTPMVKFFGNQALHFAKVPYNLLRIKETGQQIWPFVDHNHAPFYVWRNRDFTLGYKDLIQESDMWFLGNFGHLVSSYFERLYQEQEMNITRIIGNFDPQIQNMLQDQIEDGNPLPFVSENEKLLKQTNNAFAYKRSMAFTTADASSVQVQPSTYQGSVEVQGFKDLLDLCFKWCVGFELFGESATRESTATENLQRSISEREAILTYTHFITKQLKDIVRNVIFYEFGPQVDDTQWDIIIHNQRGETASAEQQAILAMYQSGLCTLPTALKMLHPTWSTRQLKQEQNALEQQQMQQQMMQMAAQQGNQVPDGNDGASSAQQPDQTSSAEQATQQVNAE